MLSKTQFDAWCCRLNLSSQAQNLIEKIRSSEPSRRVGGGRKNVSGRYPSRKMGATIQFESHRVELPAIYEFEHDEEVLEFYDQPSPIKLDYQGKNGRNLGVLHTPDFFVIRSNCAGWEECKTEEELKKLAEKSPNRYFCDSEGRWRTPPGENYAQQFELYYRLRVNTQINWVIQRNAIFLEDYFRAESFHLETAINAEIQQLVSKSPGISLAELLNHGTQASADDIYALIATEQLYVDLRVAPLAEPERVCVFSDKQTATAYGLMLKTTTSSTPMSFSAINLSLGTSVSWDGKGLSIIHVGDTEVTLQDELEQLIQLKKTLFLNLVQQAKIKSLQKSETPDIKAESWEQFYKASPEDQAEALRRYKVIEPYLNGNPPENETVSERTIRHWKLKYLTAQQQYSCGYIGLLSHRSAKGNRTRKLPEETLVLIEKFILDDYETLKQKKMWEVHSALVRVCEQQGAIAPSYKAFTKEIKKRSSYEQIKKRQGRRAAYKQETFYWELNRTTPRHGDRPFEIAHIDHTELDVELVCSRTGRSLGRPWATFLIDAYSRRFLAVYLTFDSPSYRSCLMVLRLCVQRHNRLPQIIVVDNGAEFHSVYFETLLATFECTKKNRPPAKARFGSVCERLFGTSNTQFIHNLLGNTQITRNVRQVTKSVNPKNQAIWTLGLLYEYLCAWAYEVYDADEHPALFQSPRDAFAAGMAIGGSRLHRMIPYDENFQILTLPTTSEGKAKVQSGSGVKINSIYYWSNNFRDPQIENTSVQVRYDPFDIGIAYAFVRGLWVQCISQYYAEFQGRSEKELKLASAELRKRSSNHARQSRVSAKNLVESKVVAPALRRALENALSYRSIPSRSRLYQLEPVGIGTSLVESLTSYISRLAEAHCVTPKALISRELVSFIPKTYKTTNLFEMRSLTGVLNGIGTMALDLVTVLESLTLRSDLRFLTLLTWTDIFPQRRLLRARRAWCPYCYEEWYSSKDKVIYEPLIWFFEAVTLCYLHNQSLYQQCPHCKRELPPLASYSRPGYCPYCLKWLGVTANYPSSYKTPPSKEEIIWQTWVIKTVGELLANTPHLPKPLKREIVAQAFCRYVNQFTEGNTAAFARMLEIPKNKVWMWQMGKVLPELNVILKICFTLQVSVLDFLTQETLKKNSSQFPATPQNQVRDSSTKKLEVKFDSDRTQQLLENLLQANEQPLPMTAVAKRLGYPKRVLYRHFPELCRAISAEYVKYMKESRIKRIEHCCEEVKQAVRQVHTEGIYPSEAAISRLLAKPGCFRDKKVRATFWAARREICLEP